LLTATRVDGTTAKGVMNIRQIAQASCARRLLRGDRLATLTIPQLPASSLTLLVPGIAAHHEHHAASTDDLAVLADALDAGADLHGGHEWTTVAGGSKAFEYKP
jgi:hypothetical protein